MLKNFLIVALIIAGTAGLTVVLDYASKPKPRIVEISNAPITMHDAVPDFSFTDIQGRTHDIRDFRGKIIVLNFWASWCSPCIKEFPLLLETAQRYPDDLVLIALSSDFEDQAMRDFINDKVPEALEMENVFVALDENAQVTADVFQTLRLPETIIIDAQGQMREKLIGANWGMEEMEKLIAQVR